LTGNPSSENKPSEVNSDQAATTTATTTTTTAKTMIADLKSGDKFDAFTVKSVSGNLCEKDCTTDICGKIDFDGEYVLSGQIIFNPKLSNPLIFLVNSKIPDLFYITKTKSAALNLSEKNIIILNNSNFNNSDFSAISSVIPDFSSFIENNKKSTSSIPYSKELQIKVKNLTTELCVTDKNKMNSAELVSVELSQAPDKKECTTSVFKIQYPVAWGDCQIQNDTSLTIRTDYDKYQVDLLLKINKATKDAYTKARKTANGISRLNNGEFFEEAQGGAIMSGMMLLGDKYYSYNFDVKSNQPTPEKLDGVWVPDHKVTKDILLDILLSTEVIK
jgi:hypothetical protein